MVFFNYPIFVCSHYEVFSKCGKLVCFKPVFHQFSTTFPPLFHIRHEKSAKSLFFFSIENIFIPKSLIEGGFEIVVLHCAKIRVFAWLKSSWGFLFLLVCDKINFYRCVA